MSGTEHPKAVSAAGEAQAQPAEEAKKWGTHVMGAPAAPGVHPDNQKAATWNAGDYHQPYVQYEPIDRPSNNPLEPVINLFTTWTHKAETIARNIWHNRT